MNQRITEKLLEASRRIYNSLIHWSVTGIVGVMLMPFGYLNDSVLIFALGVTAFVSSFVAISLNLIMIRGIKRNMPDDNLPPSSSPADYLDFEQVHRPASAMLEDGSITRVGKYRLTQRQWAALARALANRNWRWSRRNVAAAKVFNSITAPGVYTEITTDFERIGLLQSGWVTEKGKEQLCKMGGLRVVL